MGYENHYKRLINTIIMEKKPDYKEIYEYIVREYKNTKYFGHGPFDESFYSLLVYENCRLIIRKAGLSVNEEIVLTAALLHDIGKIRLDTSNLFDEYGCKETFSVEWHRHEELSANIASEYLNNEGYPKEFIISVCDLIRNHDKRNDNNKSMELKVLQDADLLADIGFTGFIRPFLYSGMFRSQSILDSIAYIEDEDRTESGLLLNLDVSKDIAIERIALQKELAAMLRREVDSELIK